jgi:cytoskeletal protein CcmA (bactofilin family)
MTQQSRKETLIEEGTLFKGSLASDCPIVVRGRIEGDISAPSMMVSKTGAVSGTVKVKELRSEGELAGEYDADAVYLSGTVKDKTVLRARSLEVKLSPEKGRMQVVFGECELAVGDAPAKEAAIAEALAKKAPEEPKPPFASERPVSDWPTPGDGDGIDASSDKNEKRKSTLRPTTAKDSVPPVAQ